MLHTRVAVPHLDPEAPARQVDCGRHVRAGAAPPAGPQPTTTAVHGPLAAMSSSRTPSCTGGRQGWAKPPSCQAERQLMAILLAHQQVARNVEFNGAAKAARQGATTMCGKTRPAPFLPHLPFTAAAGNVCTGSGALFKPACS